MICKELTEDSEDRELWWITFFMKSTYYIIEEFEKKKTFFQRNAFVYGAETYAVLHNK